MATLKPFRAYRYSSAAGDPSKLITQPYDKISPEMQAKYLAQSPYNFVHVDLGERRAADSSSDNVYTRSAALLEQWIGSGILVQDPEPCFYAYSQEFVVPDSGERLTRKGLIGLVRLEEYSAGIIHRHEQTLSGPKQDRLELLRHARAHFGQIFFLYPDRLGDVDSELDSAAKAAPLLDAVDEYRTRHVVHAIRDRARVEHIQSAMAPMKLLIADGHHRYETALSYRNERAQDPAAQWVMATLVNMYSPGLRILATHRVLNHVEAFSTDRLLKCAVPPWQSKPLDAIEELKGELSPPRPQSVRIGLVTQEGAWLLTRPAEQGEMDVPVLHKEILEKWLGITEEAVREEKHIHYVRGIDAAVAEVRERGAQAAFLLEATPIDEVARIAFSGGVMPQKSTDFFPKLLSGLTVYKLPD